MPKKKPAAPDFDALLGGNVLDLDAIAAARATLDPSDPRQERQHIVLGHILSVVRSTRNVCGVKVAS